jgi:hypothetical protein
VKEAVGHFDDHRAEITPAACRRNANRFSTERFQSEMARAFGLAVAFHRSGTREQEAAMVN